MIMRIKDFRSTKELFGVIEIGICMTFRNE